MEHKECGGPARESGQAFAGGETTLRDFFAAHFITGLMHAGRNSIVLLEPEIECERAYRFADAMLKVREKLELPPMGGDDDETFSRGAFELCRAAHAVADVFACYGRPDVSPKIPREKIAAAQVFGKVLHGMCYALAEAMNDGRGRRLTEFFPVFQRWFVSNYPPPAPPDGMRSPVAAKLCEVFGIDPMKPRPGNDTNDYRRS